MALNGSTPLYYNTVMHVQVVPWLLAWQHVHQTAGSNMADQRQSLYKITKSCFALCARSVSLYTVVTQGYCACVMHGYFCLF